MNSHWSIRSFKSNHLYQDRRIEIFLFVKTIRYTNQIFFVDQSSSLQSRLEFKTHLKIVDSQIRLILNYFFYIFFYSFLVVSSLFRRFLSWLNHRSKRQLNLSQHRHFKTIKIISIWKNSSLSFVEIKSIRNKSTYTSVRSFKCITSIKSEITIYTKQFFMICTNQNKSIETYSFREHETSFSLFAILRIFEYLAQNKTIRVRRSCIEQ
jgi:hypothetical protein